ncbi:hypothetical protein C2E23DRAFT_555839 [Lenzites betulinus]|nr:hypothetical protein C2E23DRAFT_555839 [Lenzites betulinus]
MLNSTPSVFGLDNALQGSIASESGSQDAVRRQISPRLAQPEEQTSIIKQEQQALSAQFNATLTVCRLPPEIILEIFAQYRAINPTIYHVNTGWVKLRLVSRYWNAVACAMPSLWREVDFHWNPSWVNLCLERSKGSTLTFIMITYSELQAKAVASIMSLHAHRLRKLVLDFDTYAHELPHAMIRQLRVLDIHALEHVHISQRVESDPFHNDLNLTHLRLPLLQTLDLHHNVLSDTQVISNLRVLRLSSCSSTLSINQFIAALAASQRLEALKLRDFLERLTGWATLSTTCQPPATLSRLTRLEVSEFSPPISAAFLTHLRLPANARILLYNNLDRADEAAYTLCAILPSSPVRYDALPVLRGSIHKLIVSFSLMDYEVSAFTGTADDPPSLSVSLSFEPTLWRYRLSRGMSDLADVFRGSPLADLQLAGAYINVRREDWINLLKAFPDLETITLYGEGDIGALWTALSSELDAHRPGDPDAPSPLCPRLKNVAYEGYFDDADAFFAAMLSCLVERAKRGLSLHSLHGYMRSRPTTEYEEMTGVYYASQLRGIVDNVDFANPISLSRRTQISARSSNRRRV